MLRNLTRSLLLLTSTVVILCIVYPLVMWAIAQIFFPLQANGSLAKNGDGQIVGSYLIAQPFTGDQYFHPRPSAASYDASASASSSLAPSNLALRDRVAQSLGPVVRYSTGQPVGLDIERWFQHDTYAGQRHLVAQWAARHRPLAQAWLADPGHSSLAEANADPVAFFADFSEHHPGCFPAVVSGKIEPVQRGQEIQALFFEMWLEDRTPAVALQEVPADQVTSSASGLDPHITLQNAELQLDRVAAAWALRTGQKRSALSPEIDALLRSKAPAPLGGLLGENIVNVLEVNLELVSRYGPRRPAGLSR